MLGFSHFVLDFTSPELEGVQGAIELSTGVSYRSGRRDDNDRPSNEGRFDGNYLLANRLGGDHTLKFGSSFRHSPEIFQQHYGGSVTARFRDGIAEAADLRRDAYEKNEMKNFSVYLSDSYRRGRLTLNVGVRTDYWDDKASPTSSDPNPIVPDKLPSLIFAGADSGVTYVNTAPRLGVTYDLTGRARTILKGSLARYYGAGIFTSDDLNPVAASRVRYNWRDLNGDALVQRDELDLTRIVNSAGYNANDPSSAISQNIVDPDLGNDITDEALVTLEHELRPNFSVSATYIYKVVHDLRVSKSLRLGGTHRLNGYVDLFNLLNANTVLLRQDQQQLSTANNVQEVLAPRVVRVGLKYQF